MFSNHQNFLAGHYFGCNHQSFNFRDTRTISRLSVLGKCEAIHVILWLAITTNFYIYFVDLKNFGFSL